MNCQNERQNNQKNWKQNLEKLFMNKMVLYSLLYLKENLNKNFDKIKGSMRGIKNDEILLGIVMKLPNSKKSMKFLIGLTKGKRSLEGVNLDMVIQGIQNYKEQNERNNMSKEDHRYEETECSNEVIEETKDSEDQMNIIIEMVMYICNCNTNLYNS